jgi:hypothetical protein
LFKEKECIWIIIAMTKFFMQILDDVTNTQIVKDPMAASTSAQKLKFLSSYAKRILMQELFY